MSSEFESPAIATVATKQVVCIKWGTFYGPQYVNVLYSMVARNITGAFRVFCFTDDARGIRREVTCLPLPELGCEIPPEVRGKWRKQALWGSDLHGVRGTVLFIDLDSITVGNIDGYFTFGEPGDVITARNWLKPWKRRAQTTLFRFEVGRHSYMLENLRANPAGISRKYEWEQNYVTECLRRGFKTWPEAWTRHFRIHCLLGWPLRYFMDPVIPRNAKIIACPGGPNPSEIILGHWRPGEEHRAPLAHIWHKWKNRRIMEKSFLREITCYVRPSRWVAEHWRRGLKCKTTRLAGCLRRAGAGLAGKRRPEDAGDFNTGADDRRRRAAPLRFGFQHQCSAIQGVGRTWRRMPRPLPMSASSGRGRP